MGTDSPPHINVVKEKHHEFSSVNGQGRDHNFQNRERADTVSPKRLGVAELT